MISLIAYAHTQVSNLVQFSTYKTGQHQNQFHQNQSLSPEHKKKKKNHSPSHPPQNHSFASSISSPRCHMAPPSMAMHAPFTWDPARLAR